MGTGPGDGEHGTGAGHEGEAAPDESGATPAAETDRMVGQIIDDGLAATGYAPGGVGATPSVAPAGAAGLDGTDRALFVLRTLDDIAAPLPGITEPPAPLPIGVDPGLPRVPPESATADGLMHVEGVDLNAPSVRMERPARGSGYAARHQYNLVLQGLAIVGLAAFLGAILFVGGQSTSPAGGGAPGGAAAVATPTPTPTPEPTPTPTPEPTPDPTPDPTPQPAPTPTAVAQSVTLRGPIDVRAMKKVGLEVGAHDVELIVFQDNGEVTGTFTIVLEAFPIGSILTGALDNADNPRWAAFKKCTVRWALEGTAKGTFNAAKGTLSGKATFRPIVEDVRDCLKTRPPEITFDPDETTTVKWSATFDGKKAKGTLKLDPALAFTATPQD